MPLVCGDFARVILDYARDATAATALANWPEKVRGYGSVRERHVKAVADQRAALREQVQQERRSRQGRPEVEGA